MRTRLMRELAAMELPQAAGPEALVAEADLAGLPEPARRYLRFMRVVGRPRDWSFRIGFRGRFRLRPGAGWLRCETWQYNSRLAVARIFHIRIRLAGIVPVLARDTYVGGKGRMLVRPLDLVTAVDGTGEEFDIGELVTYLNDMVLLAPSMLLASEVSWDAVDRRSFDIALADRGRTVAGRVFVDDRGAPTDPVSSESSRVQDGAEEQRRAHRDADGALVHEPGHLAVPEDPEEGDAQCRADHRQRAPQLVE